MGMLERARRQLQEYTGEDETPLDGDTPAWAVSLVIHVAVLVTLSVAGLGSVAPAPKPVTVIETPFEEEQEVLEIPREVSLDQVVEVDPGARATRVSSRLSRSPRRFPRFPSWLSRCPTWSVTT